MGRSTVLRAAVGVAAAVLAFHLHLHSRYGTLDACEAVADRSARLVFGATAAEEVLNPAVRAGREGFLVRNRAGNLGRLRDEEGYLACYRSMAGLPPTGVERLAAEARGEDARRRRREYGIVLGGRRPPGGVGRPASCPGGHARPSPGARVTGRSPSCPDEA